MESVGFASSVDRGHSMANARPDKHKNNFIRFRLSTVCRPRCIQLFYCIRNIVACSNSKGGIPYPHFHTRRTAHSSHTYHSSHSIAIYTNDSVEIHRIEMKIPFVLDPNRSALRRFFYGFEIFHTKFLVLFIPWAIVWCGYQHSAECQPTVSDGPTI